MHNVRDDQGKVVSPFHPPKSDKYLYLNTLFYNSFPGTSLQLSHPKYEFWAAKNVTCLPLPFLFPGHKNKNHSAQT